MRHLIVRIRYLILLLVFLIAAQGCTWFQQQSRGTKTGTGVGAALGGIAGLIIDSHNPWRGGILGVAAGAIAGGLTGNIIDHATKESVSKNAPAKYYRTTENGTNEEVHANPAGKEGDYKLVTVKYVRNGSVIGEEVRQEPIQ